MTVSVVIPTLNEESYIGGVLADLKNQDEKPAEVLVVDCGSADKTVDVVKHSGVARILRAEKPVGNQRNEGAKSAKGEIIIFLDADVRVERDFIRNAIAEFERRNLDVANSTYGSYPDHPYDRKFMWIVNWVFNAVQHFSPIGPASCLVVKKDFFFKAGGMEPKYKFDDVQFVQKAARLGKYGILKPRVAMSSRRGVKYGRAAVTLSYFVLLILCIFHQHKLANYVSYEFGAFGKRKN